ncbi:unnamed protein product [Citrullus colocynthis]|uniref:Secreted protein n=1 Tax=Citrullus colocynthis TaxID=252529 RepID=A0ABP0Y5Q8_9ROSI
MVGPVLRWLCFIILVRNRNLLCGPFSAATPAPELEESTRLTDHHSKVSVNFLDGCGQQVKILSRVSLVLQVDPLPPPLLFFLLMYPWWRAVEGVRGGESTGKPTSSSAGLSDGGVETSATW